jgi:hypothetical protein
LTRPSPNKDFPKWPDEGQGVQMRFGLHACSEDGENLSTGEGK